MKRVWSSLLALCLVGLVWTTFTWPLPRFLSEGIPSSSQNQEKGQVRAMVSGDHLQLCYHFWLLSDMFRGQTPWMHNPYEFNQGNDAARYAPGCYYVPFSLVYAAGERLGGMAVGWNLAGLLALLVSYGFTWALARRYAPNGWVAAAASVVSVTLPYRWAMLLGGSPSGYGMALVPVLFLGIDRVVRDEDWRGGVLAGTAFLFAYCSDLQTFFFCVLAAPAWAVVALVARPSFDWRDRRLWARWAGALAVALPGCLAVVALAIGFKGRLAGTDMQSGRPLSDVALFSPLRKGLFAHEQLGPSNQVLIGWVVFLVMAAGLVALVWRARRGSVGERRRLAAFLLIVVGLTAIVELALGANGVGGGKPIRLARLLVPPYAMVRQPAKILTIMPSVLAVGLALAFAALRVSHVRKVWQAGALIACAGLIAVEHRAVVKPTICLLDREQAAYAAVAADAASRGVVPRAVVLPLWPGDSHWSSIYEHYVALYRIRMLNGYAPMMRKQYVESVFRSYDTANQGYLDDSQIDGLRGMGIDYVLLHEAAYPEQVSPFPVGLALARLGANPRLECMRQAGSVWAFRILDKPVTRAAKGPLPSALLTARRWEAERLASTNMTPRPACDAGRGAVAVLPAPGARVWTTTRTRVAPVPGLRWMARLRGEGTVTGECQSDGRSAGQRDAVLSGTNWVWLAWPVETAGSALQGFSLRVGSGMAEVDTILLVAGDLLQGQGCQSVVLPAALCFHAGVTTDEGGVALDPLRDPEGEVVYAANLLLDPGEYELTLSAASDAPAQATLGVLRASGEDIKGEAAPVPGGRSSTTTRFTKTGNLPMRMAFSFAREGRITVLEFRVKRSAQPAGG